MMQIPNQVWFDEMKVKGRLKVRCIALTINYTLADASE